MFPFIEKDHPNQMHKEFAISLHTNVMETATRERSAQKPEVCVSSTATTGSWVLFSLQEIELLGCLACFFMDLQSVWGVDYDSQPPIKKVNHLQLQLQGANYVCVIMDIAVYRILEIMKASGHRISYQHVSFRFKTSKRIFPTFNQTTVSWCIPLFIHYGS